jgi:DNA anti-recombination protein RmuC
VTTFGTKEWPPPELLPAAVRDRLTAFGEARDRVAKLAAELGDAQRLGLPQAKRRDLEAAADAVEQGKPAPKTSHEAKLLTKMQGLEQQIAAAELVQQRCLARLNAAVEEHAAQISHEAERRMGRAKQDYLDAIERLAGASQALTEAGAFQTWASDPVGSSFKQRSLRNVPIERHADEGPSIDMVLDGLRRVLEPRQRPSIPSPFPAPQAEPEAEPAAAHSFEAELAAGVPPRPRNL